ncbi:hypothetical protein STRIP9103_09735, partial [Streptomyces ipomoeae 91-03]
DADSEAPL